MKKSREDKRGIIADYLPWLILAVVVIVISFIAIFLLKEKGISYIDYIKNFFRGG